MIEIKAMTLDQSEAFYDFQEELEKKLNAKEMSVTRYAFKLAKWTLENVYGVDIATTDINIGTAMEIHRATIKASDRIMEEELKNYVKSGNGEKEAE